MQCIHRSILLILYTCITIAQTGCGNHRSIVLDVEDHDLLFAAMVGAANDPSYEDWYIVENNVWSDREQERVEIFRRVTRQLRSPDRPGFREENREWKFQVYVEPSKKKYPDSPPRVVFLHRGFAIPAWVWIEADLYFKDLRDILAGRVPEPGGPGSDGPMSGADAMKKAIPSTQPTTQPESKPVGADILPEY